MLFLTHMTVHHLKNLGGGGGVEVLQCCYSHFYSEKDKLQVCGIIKKKECIIMIHINYNTCRLC